MSWARLACVTAPTAQPVTLAEAKLHLRVDFDDDDDLISSLIVAATQRFDGRDGVGFWLMPQVWRLSLDAFPPWQIDLPGLPVRSIVSITYVDGDGTTQTLAAENYRFDAERYPVRVTPAYGLAWPLARAIDGAVKVTFNAGHADAASIPDRIKAGIKLTLGHWYRNRESVAAGKMAELPEAVAAIVSAYRAGYAA